MFVNKQRSCTKDGIRLKFVDGPSAAVIDGDGGRIAREDHLLLERFVCMSEQEGDLRWYLLLILKTYLFKQGAFYIGVETLQKARAERLFRLVPFERKPAFEHSIHEPV